MSLRLSQSMCCVVGCNNRYCTTNSKVKFYGFPGRWYEKERRNIWIQRVNRADSENKSKLWQPTKHDKICSEHFVGNKKSDVQSSPSYHPSIFPKIYHPTNSLEKERAREKRSRRLESRNQKKGLLTSTTSSSIPAAPTSQVEDFARDQNKSTQEIEDVPIANNAYVEQGCQADIIIEDTPISSTESFVFMCDFSCMSNDVSTQISVSPASNTKFYQVEDKSVGNHEELICSGFHGYESIKDDEDINILCGITKEKFLLLLSYMTVSHGNSKLSIYNCLLMFLMKFKTGLSYSALSILFSVHRTTVSRTFINILVELFDKTKHFVFWPERSVIDLTMPEAFKTLYPQCRCIIDCSEIKIARPNKVDDAIYTYSQYKSGFTAKFFIAVAPNGFISFMSSCYGGRASDAFITNDCGFLDLLEPGDVVLADKGFPGIKKKDDVVMVLPPFLHDGRLEEAEVEETYKVASVRIHVERSIQRIKIYNILQKIPVCLFQFIDKIVFFCAVLANLQPPTMKTEHEDDSN